MLRETRMQAAALIYSQRSAIYIIFKNHQNHSIYCLWITDSGKECPA